MNKITLIYENNQYYLQIVNSVNDTVITRIIMTKPEIATLYASLQSFIE